MLEYIRTSAQSFGVKVAFGVIILVFVFWGVGNFNDRDYSNVVAVVNGQPILAQEFERAYRGAEEYLLRANPGLTREQLIRDHLGRTVLNDLIRQTLVLQEAERAGITVTPVELRQAVGKMRAFQDDKGRFDPDAYTRVLAAQRKSPAQYEKELADELLAGKIYALVTAPAWTDPDEARRRYDFLRERRSVDYLFVPASRFADKVEVTDAEARAWYDGHKADFAIPARVNVAYVAVRPEELVKPETVSEADARAWYEANKGHFEQPEQVRAAHILVPLPQDADAAAEGAAREALAEAQARLKAGEPFAKVADAVNPEGAAGPGGELGWVTRGKTVPAFEEAAFALEPGTISEPVRSPFGFHLILVEEKNPGGVREFEKVIAEARKGAAFEQGSDKLHEALDSLIEDNILNKPLAESAERHGLKAAESGFLDREGLMEKLGVKPEGAEALLAAGAGLPVDSALEAGDSYLVARVIATEPPSTRPFADVKDGIVKILGEEKALADALASAQATLAGLRNGPLSEAEAKKLGLKEAPAMERGGSLADFAQDPALTEAIFADKPGDWLSRVYSVTGPEGPGALICRVAKVLPPDDAGFESVAEALAEGVQREREDAVYAIFIQSLADKAKVEVVNSNLVDRVNM
ncbi:SurA N-terminal domain-containing protein [Desulfovibrio sp.]|uniref:SurA N-terminal domain-containing protein n=1 Tax=Desulfovibrio sp. TaxID=885 RepID=UPI0023CA26FB|nr:SurA N-terminal domain-containing protein [Desulfovibrio sp.]MDE7240742.1 SurA N-terminal domain-containing protein [Desulfovibrio sp.]